MAGLPLTKSGKRNKAMLLVGFAGALRSSELLGLDYSSRSLDGWGTLSFNANGMKIRLHRTKNDQVGRGLDKFIPLGCRPCPVEAVRDWLDESAIQGGALFRSISSSEVISLTRLARGSVTQILRRAAMAALMKEGRPADACAGLVQALSGHSLRSGFVTSAVRAGQSSDTIARHVGWATKSLVIRYARYGEKPDQFILGDVLADLRWHMMPNDDVNRGS